MNTWELCQQLANYWRERFGLPTQGAVFLNYASINPVQEHVPESNMPSASGHQNPEPVAPETPQFPTPILQLASDWPKPGSQCWSDSIVEFLYARYHWWFGQWECGSEHPVQPVCWPGNSFEHFGSKPSSESGNPNGSCGRFLELSNLIQPVQCIHRFILFFCETQKSVSDMHLPKKPRCCGACEWTIGIGVNFYFLCVEASLRTFWPICHQAGVAADHWDRYQRRHQFDLVIQIGTAICVPAFHFLFDHGNRLSPEPACRQWLLFCTAVAIWFHWITIFSNLQSDWRWEFLQKPHPILTDDWAAFSM